MSDSDDIRLQSGRIIYANRRIFGLTPDLELTDGYDGEFFENMAYDSVVGDSTQLTTEERIEIAEMMIDRWQRWSKLEVVRSVFP